MKITKSQLKSIIIKELSTINENWAIDKTIDAAAWKYQDDVIEKWSNFGLTQSACELLPSGCETITGYYEDESDKLVAYNKDELIPYYNKIFTVLKKHDIIDLGVTDIISLVAANLDDLMNMSDPDYNIKSQLVRQLKTTMIQNKLTIGNLITGDTNISSTLDKIYDLLVNYFNETEDNDTGWSLF